MKRKYRKMILSSWGRATNRGSHTFSKSKIWLEKLFDKRNYKVKKWSKNL